MRKLTEEQKQSVIDAAIKYISNQSDDFSQAAFARLVGIDKAYVNQIVNNKLFIGKTEIADKYFNAIANFLNLNLDKTVWGHFNTYNFKSIVVKLNSARSKKERCGIDGNTGVGKTYACEYYKKKYPTNTFVVKCNATDNTKELVQSIAREVKVSDSGTKGKIINRICDRLISLGNDAMLIIDEAENLKKSDSAIDVVKVIGDLLEGRVAFAVVGLGIRNILLSGSKRKRQGYIQTNRRFSMGWIECADLTTEDIDEVCHSIGIKNKSALNWIYANITDYDSLKRVCTDAIEESEKSGSEINKLLLESLFSETTKYR